MLQTTNWAAKRLNLREQAVYRMVREGLFPNGVVVKLGRSIRFHPERLEEWLLSGGSGLETGARQ